MRMGRHGNFGGIHLAGRVGELRRLGGGQPRGVVAGVGGGVGGRAPEQGPGGGGDGQRVARVPRVPRVARVQRVPEEALAVRVRPAVPLHAPPPTEVAVLEHVGVVGICEHPTLTFTSDFATS